MERPTVEAGGGPATAPRYDRENDADDIGTHHEQSMQALSAIARGRKRQREASPSPGDQHRDKHGPLAENIDTGPTKEEKTQDNSGSDDVVSGSDDMGDIYRSSDLESVEDPLDSASMQDEEVLPVTLKDAQVFRAVRRAVDLIQHEVLEDLEEVANKQTTKADKAVERIENLALEMSIFQDIAMALDGDVRGIQAVLKDAKLSSQQHSHVATQDQQIAAGNLSSEMAKLREIVGQLQEENAVQAEAIKELREDLDEALRPGNRNGDQQHAEVGGWVEVVGVTREPWWKGRP